MDINGFNLPAKVRTPNTMDVNGVSIPLNEEIPLQPAFFETSQGVNENTYFDLQVGFSGISVEPIDKHTYFNLLTGVSGLSIENSYISLWNVRTETGESFTLNGSVTITSIPNPSDTYTLFVIGGEWVLYPFTDSNLNIVQHSILFESATTNQSGYIEITPSPGIYTITLYQDTERQNINISSFGSWSRALNPAEIMHLHNNGKPNNPWFDFPLGSHYIQPRNMQSGMNVWHQFQNSVLFDDAGTLKVENLAGGLDSIVNGFTSLSEINENVRSIDKLI